MSVPSPLISVIIPSYNHGRFIADAIGSVLAQSYTPLEIIVVDDESTDNTLDMLHSFGDNIIVIKQKNQGQSVARNVGIQAAHGEIIGMLDSDDMWTPNHIAVLLPILLEDSLCDIVRGEVQRVLYYGTDHEVWGESSLQYASLGTCLCRRRIFDSVGWFDPHMRQGQDTDWAVRIKEAGCVQRFVSDTVLWYRRHEHNLTNDPARVKLGYVQTMANTIARKKQKIQKDS